MASKIDGTSLVLAVLAGVVLGVLAALGAHALGLPGKLVGPITGGIVGALVPLIYRMRTDGNRREG